MGFEYVSNQWVLAVADAIVPAKGNFTVGTATCVFPDRVMILGLKLKYFAIKGFDTAAFQRDYMKHLDIAKASDAGSQTLSMAPVYSSELLTEANIPDSGYGS